MTLQTIQTERFIQGALYPDLFDGESPIMLPANAYCVGCGCSDSAPCINTNDEETCGWLIVNDEINAGVCSNCEDWLEVFRTAIQKEPFLQKGYGRAWCQRCDHVKELVHTPDYSFSVFVCETCDI